MSAFRSQGRVWPVVLPLAGLAVALVAFRALKSTEGPRQGALPANAPTSSSDMAAGQAAAQSSIAQSNLAQPRGTPAHVRPALTPGASLGERPFVREQTPLAVAQSTSIAQAPAAATKPARLDPSDEFFTKGHIPQLRIQLNKDQEQKLRADQRQYVECSFTEDGKLTYKARVKLKGAAGSFRNLDDRPALTINMGQGKKAPKKDDAKKGDAKKGHARDDAKKGKAENRRFHGLDKFHLNNSVQDESYLAELICSQLCREAGCPAARVTHARVWLNDRDLGFYVLKEGLDEHFIRRNFPGSQGRGNLYDGGFLLDIDAGLERDEGEGPDDKADLKKLLAACREGDPSKRWPLIAERLDVDAFLNFVALELMMSHWDGYAQNRNNYRVYFRADNKQAVFFPHGMDQMFADPGYSVFHVPGPIVANAVLQNPEWKAKYHQRVRELLPAFAPEKLHAKIDEAHRRIRPVVAGIHPDRARQLDDRVRNFRNLMNDRAKNIRAQFPPEPIAFNKEGWALVEHWEPKPDGDARLEKKEIAGRGCLSLETGPSKRCTASFRSKVRLGKGSYRFEAQVKPTNVAPLSDGKASGAGLRLSGGVCQNAVSGTTDWQTVSHAFDVTEDLREVELVIELRSTAGAALFDAASLRVIKIK